MPVLTINQKFRAVTVAQATAEPSEAVLKTAEMFGIGLDESYEVTLFEGLRVDVRPGDVVYVTGPSGSGKSVLLARMAEALREAWPDARFADLAAVVLTAGRTVIDLLQPPLERALKVLSAAGLADAFLLLRTPEELSDGQRWRLRLALAMENVNCGLNSNCPMTSAQHATPYLAPGEYTGGEAAKDAPSPCGPPCIHGGLNTANAPGANPQSSIRNPQSFVLVADEFCSTLDRLCARAVAYRVRRMASREGVTVLAASAHDDLLEDLAPDVLVVKHEGIRVEVLYADPSREEARP
jgi:ABC-type ATPase with predicted acetyltransferase domain